MSAARSPKLRMALDAKSLKALQRRMKSITGKVKTQVTRRALRRGGMIFKDEAIGNAPVGETAELVESIELSVKQIRRDRESMNALVGPSRNRAHVGRFLNYGTNRITARRWLARAYDSKRTAVFAEIAATFERFLKRRGL